MSDGLVVAIEGDMRAKAPGFRNQLERLNRDGRFTVRFLDEGGAARKPVLDPEELGDVDMLILMRRRVDASSLENVDRLRWIGRFGAGFDTVDLPSCTSRGILVSNAPHGVRQSVAELVLAYMLAASTRLLFFDRYIREQGFSDKGRHVTRCIAGKTLGLIGCGGIARHLAGLVEPFGMMLLAFDPYADAAEIQARGIRPVTLEEVFSSSDFVSLHVPLTETTRGMITEQHFRMMKPGACFINTSRGGLYEEASLARVLDEGVIATAAVDVFESEPEVTGNPLLSCDSSILTPHIAGTANNLDAIRMVMESLVDSVFMLADGQLPDNTLNPEAARSPVPPEKRSPSFKSR